MQGLWPNFYGSTVWLGGGIWKVVAWLKWSFLSFINRAEEFLGFLGMSHTGWRNCVCERWHVWANNHRPISA